MKRETQRRELKGIKINQKKLTPTRKKEKENTMNDMISHRQ